MDNNPSANSGQDGKFLNGFLLGFIIGAFVVFLLGTKKGKKLLQAISEQGAENINNILSKVDEDEGFDEVMEEDIKKPVARRFFKGTPRRVN